MTRYLMALIYTLGDLYDNFTIAALLALLLGLSYNRHQIKRRANEELALQKEKIDNQTESLNHLLSEREWLLKEIHHRVRNNLQIVISLLNLQLFTIKDAAAKDAIRESQQRMHAISMIHQRLYQHEEVSRINIADYVCDLTYSLQDSFGEHGTIIFNIDIEPLLLDVAQAVPLGLILSEAITNSIKYTVVERTLQAVISISLRKVAEQIEIEIVDNGKGLPADVDPNKTKSLGMRLITGLTRQLKGTIKFSNNVGLRISLLIPVKAPFSEE